LFLKLAELVDLLSRQLQSLVDLLLLGLRQSRDVDRLGHGKWRCGRIDRQGIARRRLPLDGLDDLGRITRDRLPLLPADGLQLLPLVLGHVPGVDDLAGLILSRIERRYPCGSGGRRRGRRFLSAQVQWFAFRHVILTR
jgi:hypothetical protein